VNPIIVHKYNHAGKHILQYEGEMIDSGPTWVNLRAVFSREDADMGFVTFRRGDVFIEWFYTDRWYNVFEIRDWKNDALKGWYCNLGRPAVWDAPEVISYVDLALDLWVSSTGQQTVLDEDEFSALNLDEKTRRMVRAALRELQAMPWLQLL
jgi:protein associated with RNAse G/E